MRLFQIGARDGVRASATIVALAILATVTFWSTGTRALSKGDAVSAVKVKDSRDKDAAIPDIGVKVLALFYTDPDVQNQNEPFRELLNRSDLDVSKFRGLGVVNMKDTLLANALIRSVVRGKEKKFNSLILTDPAHILKNAWNLGECNGKDVVIIIGRDGRVKYFKAGKMSPAEMDSTLALVRSLISE